MVGVLVVWSGLAVAALGGVSLVKPLAFLRIRTRQRGALALGAGLALVALGMLLPATETQVEVTRTRLDEFAPAYQFSEFHRIHIKAPRDRVYRAVKEVTAEEIIALCAEQLGSYKKPSGVEFQTEPLPKSAVGKVKRKDLREPHWAGRARRISGS